MGPVLDINTLLESPLADLHALAGELDIEGYRLLRKADLTIAILEQRGAIADEIRPSVEAKASELAAIRAERERQLAEREEAEEEAREAAREEAARKRREATAQRGDGRERQQRGQRGGRGRGAAGDRRPGERSERAQRERAGRETTKSRPEGGARRERGGRDRGAKPSESDQPLVAISGVFEPGSGGGGRLRTDLARRTRGDADVQRGDVRKWRLHRGDTIVGEARKIKRGRTDHQLVSIKTVNGLGEPPVESKRVRFSEVDAAPAGRGSRFARKLFKHAPVFGGSRVIVTGPTRAASSEMLARLADDLASSGVTTSLIVSVARPEETVRGTGAGYDLVVNEPGKSAEEALSAIELAIERGKRLAESGADAAVLIDGLDLLPSEKVDDLAAASRNLAQHGSLTVIGSAGSGSALEAQATTIAVVAGGRRIKLDKKASWSADR